MRKIEQKRATPMTVVTCVLEGDGKAVRAEHRAAFENRELAEPLRTLVDKIASAFSRKVINNVV